MDDQPLNDLWCFNPAEREWTQLEADGAPEPRSYHQVRAYKDYLSSTRFILLNTYRIATCCYASGR